MTEHPTSENSTTWRFGLAAWIGIPLLHLVWIMIDWNLRDPERPVLGGVPAVATTAFQWISLTVFCVLVAASTAGFRSKLLRVLITIAATGVAGLGMIFAWLSYVIGEGIDTL